MRARRLFIVTFILFLLASHGESVGFASAAESGDGWDISGEIRRLYEEVPSMSAYADAQAVVWLDSLQYSLLPDGAMEKTRRFLMLMGQRHPGDQMAHVMPSPQDESSSLSVAEAAWYNPMTGMREGVLPVKEQGEGISRRIEIEFPRETEGRVVAVTTRERHVEKPYFDEVLFLAGEYPIWEQSVTVDIPDGMDLYWQGVGVREPVRRRGGGREVIAWTLMNQPVWRGVGILDTRRPAIAFSLRRGPSASLRALQEAVDNFQAPPMPSDLQIKDRGNLVKAGESMAAYMTKKTLSLPGFTPERMRTGDILPMDGPWTSWEQTVIIGKWLESMGHPVGIYWSQRFPASEDGPNALGLWEAPILLLKPRNEREKEILFKAGQAAEFGRTAPSLCGKTIFRMTGGTVETFNVPAGDAAEHTLGQAWDLALDEKGMAVGSLEITMADAWVDALLYGSVPPLEALSEAISGCFTFNAPGLTLSPLSVARTGAGYRIAFAVNAALGIVAGSDILMRVPSAMPRCLEEIASAGDRYSLRFPFTLAQSVKIATPRGYRTVGALPAEKQGDSKAAFEESMIHWPKRGELEVSGKWAVRTLEIDETLSRVILGQLNSYIRWSQTTLPLRGR